MNIHRSGVLTALAWLVPQESAARESQSRRVLCTPYNHAPCHFIESHIRKVYACLAVTCHLRFWQSDRGLLRATAVTRGWNGYRNKGQHRKLILEKKILQIKSLGEGIFNHYTTGTNIITTIMCHFDKVRISLCNTSLSYPSFFLSFKGKKNQSNPVAWCGERKRSEGIFNYIQQAQT